MNAPLVCSSKAKIRLSILSETYFGQSLSKICDHTYCLLILCCLRLFYDFALAYLLMILFSDQNNNLTYRMSYIHRYRFQFQLVAKLLQSNDSSLKLQLEEDHRVGMHFEEIHDTHTTYFNRGGQVSFPVGVKSHSTVSITGDEDDVLEVLEKFEKMDSKMDFYSAALRKDQTAGNRKFEKMISNAKKQYVKQVATISRHCTNEILIVRRDEEIQVRIIWLNLVSIDWMTMRVTFESMRFSF